MTLTDIVREVQPEVAGHELAGAVLAAVSDGRYPGNWTRDEIEAAVQLVTDPPRRR